MLTVYLSLIDTEEQRTRFEELYRENSSIMLSLAFRILGDHYGAEDAVHDAFVRAADSMDTINRLNGWQARRYLLTAAKHAAIDLYRKRSKQASLELSYEDLEIRAEIEPGEDEKGNAVLEAVKGLPEHYRDVFLLKYSLGLTNEEIGGLLKLTVSGVKQRISRGKELLRKKLVDEGIFL